MGFRFTSRELTVCALMGAAIFIVCYVLGTIIITLTGIPGTGSILQMFIIITLLVLGIKIVPKPGAILLISLIIGILIIPTIIGGPPGAHKIFIPLLTGLPMEIIVYASKRSYAGNVAAGVVGGFSLVIWVYLSLIFLGLPGADKLEPILTTLTLVNTALGAIGAHFGYWIYENKLKRRASLRQFLGKN